jgi:hypothetical protein
MYKPPSLLTAAGGERLHLEQKYLNRLPDRTILYLPTNQRAILQTVILDDGRKNRELIFDLTRHEVRCGLQTTFKNCGANLVLLDPLVRRT